jgi:uncharacterized protein YegL
MSTNITGINDVKNLFSNSVNDGDMDTQMSSIMINSLNGTNLAGCMGTSADDMETDDVTLVKIVLDASISMKRFEQTVRDSYDKFIKSFKDSKQSGSILVSTISFASTSKIIHGFKKSDEIDPIGNNYGANGGSTAVYDAALDAMTGIKAYSKSLNDSGVRTKNIVVIFSDGEDNDSKISANKVKTVSEGLLRSEMFYLVYIGFQHDPNDDLQKIADAIGFPTVHTAAISESEIRKTVDLVSKSIIRTSQTQIGKSNSFFS